MDITQRIVIERECTRLVQRYCSFVDEYRHEDLVALWADDGLWETWQGPLRTHAELRAYLKAKPRDAVTIHIPHSILVDVIDEDRAEAVSAFTYHGTDRSDPTAVTPRVVGRWRDRFARTAAGWRFAYRGTDILFKAG